VRSSATLIRCLAVGSDMGVDLGDLVPRTPIGLRDLAGKVVAIDGHNALYQFLSIIRQPDGTPLRDRRGRITSHLSGLFYRTANLVEAGIKPVYVWDGLPHALKRATIDGRAAVKAKAESARQAALAAGDTRTAFSKATQTSHLDREMLGEAKKLLDALGIPHLSAPGDGEAQASHMAARSDVHAAVSQDYDALLFGAPRLVRNLAVTGRRKLPGRQVYVDVEPEEILLAPSLSALGLTREQLVDVGLLVGTDFHPGVHGVGPKKAVKLVKEHGNLEGALAKLGVSIPEADEIRRIFLSPAVTSDYALAWKPASEAAVTELLVHEHDFSLDRMENTFAKYRVAKEQMRQRSLDAFFG